MCAFVSFVFICKAYFKSVLGLTWQPCLKNLNSINQSIVRSWPGPTLTSVVSLCCEEKRVCARFFDLFIAAC